MKTEHFEFVILKNEQSGKCFIISAQIAANKFKSTPKKMLTKSQFKAFRDVTDCTLISCKDLNEVNKVSNEYLKYFKEKYPEQWLV